MKVLKTIADYAQINAPNGATFAVIKLADIRDVSAIVLSVVSVICTIWLTRHKTKGKE